MFSPFSACLNLQCALVEIISNIFEHFDMAESPSEQFVTQPPAAFFEGLGSQGKCKAEDYTTYEKLKVTEGQKNPLILACQQCQSKILRADQAVLISREVSVVFKQSYVGNNPYTDFPTQYHPKEVNWK